jgi:CheY-like chemotaxis protein
MGGKLLLQSKLGQGSTFSFTLAFKSAKVRLGSSTDMGHIFVANSSPSLRSTLNSSPIRLNPLLRRNRLLRRVVGNSPARILIVDDTPVNCKLLTRTFLSSAKRLGITAPKIVTALNGQIAVELVAASLTSPIVDPEKGEGSRPAHFNLICMDRQMPVLCGVEATRQIKGLQRSFSIPAQGISQLLSNAQDPKAAYIPAYIVGMSASIENSTEWLDAGVDEMLPKPFSPLEIDNLLLAMCSSTSAFPPAK